MPISFTVAPRDAFSEVVDERRRWTPEWYSFLQELTNRVAPPVFTTANLPPAASYPGLRLFVTDATATTFMSTLVGGGSNKVPVVSDGTVWKIG